MAIVKTHLHDLHGSLRDKGSAPQSKAVNILADLKMLIPVFHEKDVGYVASLLFHEKTGLLAFALQSVQMNELTKAREECLEVLLAYLDRVQYGVQDYAVRLKSACVTLYPMSKGAREQEYCLLNIQKILEYYKDDRTENLMQIDKLAATLYSALVDACRTASFRIKVKQRLYQLLGFLAKKYPEHMVEYENKMLKMFLQELKKQTAVSPKECEQSLMEGCFVGLSYFMYSFTLGFDENPARCKEVFAYVTYLLHYIHRGGDRYSAAKAAMDLLKDNAQQFGELLYEQHADVFKCLSSCAKHRDRELKRKALGALKSVMHQVAALLADKFQTTTDRKPAKDVFEFFMEKFANLVESQNAIDVQVAVEGYGAFASPCRLFSELSRVKEVYAVVLRKTEQLYLRKTHGYDDEIHRMPLFLEALANILRHVDQVDIVSQKTMESLIILQIENFPYLTDKRSCHRCLLVTFLSLYTKGAVFRAFLSRIVFQSLLRLCSLALYVDEIANIKPVRLVEDDPRKVTYKSYVPLWTALLEGATMKELNVLNFPLADRKIVTELLYDEIMNAVWAIVEQLDLSTTPSASGENLGGSESEFLDAPEQQEERTPTTPLDFRILANMAYFCTDLFPSSSWPLFEKWIPRFSQQITLFCTRFARVSSFYKLMALCLNMCCKLHYFKDVGKDAHQTDRMDDDGEETKQKRTTFILFSKHSREVFCRIREFKGDLLVSCLHLLLNLPSEIAVLHLPALREAMQMALKLGLSYSPLALSSMDALEMWRLELPEEKLAPLVREILPSVWEYLISCVDNTDDATYQRLHVLKVSSVTSTKRRRQLIVKASVLNKELLAESQKSWSHVCRRMLLLLGSLGGIVSSSVHRTSFGDVDEALTVWDSKKHLQFTVPFVDLKPTIALDEFLPRICDVASCSGDRKTKIAACELLHALVLLMVGNGAHKTAQMQQKYPMDQVYRCVFPVLLRLACDPDEVTRKLFEPLVMQLIHWFTSYRQLESRETAALLSALMDGIVDASSLSVRDFCARCAREFLVWSIKHSAVDKIAQRVANTKLLTKHMYSYCLHPNPFCRRGAALMFNNIYTVFREDKDLVNIFTVEMVVHFVNSLAMAHRDEKSYGTQYQCVEALSHLERIIVERSAIFNAPHPDRRLAGDLREATLDRVVEWLLEKSGRLQTCCRHACMNLVCKLSLKIDGIESPEKYFLTVAKKKGPNYFVSTFEGGGDHEGASLKAVPRLDEGASASTMLLWFDALLAALDCYLWVFGEGLLSPRGVFASNSSTVFRSLECFVREFALKSLPNDRSVFTPKEIDDYNLSKCTVVIRCFDFVSVLLRNYPQDVAKVVPEDFWNADFWHLVTACVLKPSDVGFNVGDVEITEKLPVQLVKLLQSLKKAGSLQEQSKAFLRILGDEVALTVPALVDAAALGRGEGKLMENGASLKGIEMILKCGFDTALVPASFCRRAVRCVLDATVDDRAGCFYEVVLRPAQATLVQKMLGVAFLFPEVETCVVKAMFDATPVHTASEKVVGTRGELFFAAGCRQLSEHVASRANIMIPLMMKESMNSAVPLMILIVDHVLKSKELRKRYGKPLMDTILPFWPLMGKSDVDRVGLDALLLKLMTIDQKVVLDTNKPWFESIFNTYLNALKNAKLSTLPQEWLLELLPFFCQLERVHVDRLKCGLHEMAARNFPLSSREFSPGSSKYDEYTTVFRKLLEALTASGSAMLLEFLMSVVCRERHHLLEEEIGDALKTFVQRLTLRGRKEAADLTFAVFADADSYSDAIRTAAVEQFTVRILRCSVWESVEEFFRSHIEWIVASLRATLARDPEERGAHVVTKTGCLMLVESLYRCVPKPDVNSSLSKINKAFCNGAVSTGRELTQEIARISNGIKKEDGRKANITDQVHRQLYRRLHCAAYNALAAVISCTQTDPKFYTLFLFTENEEKGEYLWDNLVDPRRVYKFDFEQSSLVKKRQFLVSLRESHRVESDELSPSTHPALSLHYLSSQYLSMSSFSEEVSQFDFTSTAKVMTEVNDRGKYSPVKRKREGDAPTQPVTGVPANEVFELKCDELNEHECMVTVTALLKHMRAIGVVPPKSIPAPDTMPPWMNALRNKMSATSTRSNVKLFLAKIIVNNHEVFEAYAKFWLEPLMQLIVSEAVGDSINDFTVEVMEVVLKWASAAVLQEADSSATASRLLEFLVENAHHPQRVVTQINLELIKSVVECWKSCVQIPYGVIYKKMNRSDENCSIAIQVLAIAVLNGFPPYSVMDACTEHTFLSQLVGLMKADKKEIFAAGSEVVGMILQQHAASGRAEKEEALVQLVLPVIDHLYKRPQDKFLNVLHNIQKHYSSLTRSYVSKLLFILPTLHGAHQHTCITLLSSQVQHIENAFVEFKTTNILGLLNHRHEGIQLASLRIVQALLKDGLRPDALAYLLPTVAGLSQSTRSAVRKTVYEICKEIYGAYKNATEEAQKDLRATAKSKLLHGLGDSDFSLRLMNVNFWIRDIGECASTVERAVAVLDSLYSPSTEHEFLNYATYILLENTSQSPDFSSPIFLTPLSECRFTAYPISASWHERHSGIVTQLFVDSSSMQMDWQREGPSSEQHLRATQQTPSFSATQNVGAGEEKTFNWLTQSTVDVSGTTLPVNDAASSLHCINTLPRLASSAAHPQGGGDVSSTVTRSHDDPGGEDIHRTLRHLKRSLAKDPEETRNFFARKTILKQSQTEKEEFITRKKQESEVTLYRKYRKGDFPDIEIPSSAVIIPLQALAQRDKIVAKILFSSLLNSIWDEMEKSKPPSEMELCYRNLSVYLNKMLTETSTYSPSLMGSILHISFHCCDKFKLSVDNVAIACAVSRQEDLGILLLEEYIRKGSSNLDERPSKRARSSRTETSPDLEEWMKLAELYKSLGNVDVVRGIFELKFGGRKLSRLALRDECRKNYSGALSYYTEAINASVEPDSEPLQAEYEYWEDAIMKCYNNLTEWEGLEKYALQLLPGASARLDEIWDDSHYQEHHLPFLLRSKTKLVLGGRDDPGLPTFIDAALADGASSHKAALLQSRHAQDLSLLLIAKADYDRASHFLTLALDNFLREWVAKPNRFSLAQKNDVQKLQAMADEHGFLSAVKFKGSTVSSRLDRLLSIWFRCLPDALDSVTTWDDVVTNRLLYVDRLYRAGAENEDRCERTSVEAFQFRLKVSYVESMIEQGNVPVALKLLRESRALVKRLSEPAYEVEWTHAYVRAHHHQFENELGRGKVEPLFRCWKQLNKLDSFAVLRLDSTLACSHAMLHARSAEFLMGALEENPQLVRSLDEMHVDVLKRLSVEVSGEVCEVADGLRRICIDQLKEAIGNCTRSETAFDTKARANLQLALYCNQYLLDAEDEERPMSAERKRQMPEIVVHSLLEALKLNSVNARHYFPRVLQLLCAYPFTGETFRQKASEVPSWMFLRWTSQMVALLDKREAPAVQDIVASLVELYPQAAVFPFKLSRERYAFSNDAAGRKNKAFVEKICASLSKLHVVDEFVDALNLLTNVECILTDHASTIVTLKKQRDDANAPSMLEAIERLWSDVVEYDDPRSRYRCDISKECKADFESAFGKKGKKIVQCSLKEFHEKLAPLKLKLTERTKQFAKGAPLKNYSGWFERVLLSHGGSDMEIPGQYAGDRKPLVDYHVKVAGFDPKILPLSSLRMPKRITLRGHDNKEYRFLVKSGEDLRTDQRVEQLFDIMNRIYASDPACASSDVAIVTYQVIPLTLRLGLIEWIDEAVTLQDFLDGTMGEEERERAHREESHVVAKMMKKGDWTTVNHQCAALFCNFKVPEIVSFHRQLRCAYPQDLIRRGLMKWSINLESYLSLRNSFLASHAVLCVSHYVLGIGDRHAKNFMVSRKTGKMVGIDFGHCFGSATQFLPFPELMPFRLTHQFQRLMEPLGRASILRPVMIHTLSALRAKPEILLNTMDVFIKEPTLDWMMLAKKQIDAGQAIGEDESDLTWYPRQRVAFAKRKLKGANPACITKDELTLGQSKSKVYKEFVETCLGREATNVRAQVGPTDLTPEEQVDCLIDQATDENLLGRTYVGWKSWT